MSNGLYLARSIRTAILPYIKTYIGVVQDELLPAFGDLEAKADAVTEKTFGRLGGLTVCEESVADMGDVAEDAENAGISYYLTMTNLRQASLNLYTVGLFHLLEQQLASICQDGLFRGLPKPTDGSLTNLQTWYSGQLGIDLRELPEWRSVDDLRLVANTTKHAEGGSARQLRARRPDLFQNPLTADMLAGQTWLQAVAPVEAPLAGDGLFVKVSDFQTYGNAVVRFVESMADSFQEFQRY